MNTHKSSVTVVTHGHFLRGDAHIPGDRLVDVLNDPTSDYLRLQNVDVFRLSHDARAATLPHTAIPKEHIGMVLLTAHNEETPAAGASSEYAAFVIALGFDIRGTIRLRGCADPVNAMSREFGSFFQVHDAVVTHGVHPQLQLKVPETIIRRDFVGTLHLDEDSSSEGDVLESLRELMPSNLAAEPQHYSSSGCLGV